METLGVSVAFLEAFRSKCVAHLDQELQDGTQPSSASSFTTTGAASSIVLKDTLASRVAYMDLFRDKLDDDGKPFVASATVFVSHAWRYNILEVLDVMIEYGQQDDEETQYFWFDLFVNNQHDAPARDHTWWCTTFKQSIGSIGTTLLILAPWDNPIPVTRAWCLWEILCTVQQDAELVVRMPAAQQAQFAADILANPDRALEALASIQGEKAQAMNPADLEMILAAVRATVGFEALNSTVKARLRRWLLEAAEDVVHARAGHEVGDSERLQVANLQLALVTMIRELGYADHALEYARAALDFFANTYDEGHPRCADAHQQVAAVLADMGDMGAALTSYAECLRVRKATLGDEHIATSVAYNNMGATLSSLGRAEEALRYLEESLRIKLLVLGTHEDTAVTLGAIGYAYYTLHMHKDAAAYYTRALDMLRATLGDRHPLVASVLTYKALLAAELGEAEEAITLYRQVLSIQVETLGESHPNTINTYKALGEALSGANNSDEAFDCFEKVMLYQLSLMDEAHPEYLSTRFALANAYMDASEFDKAATFCAGNIALIEKQGAHTGEFPLGVLYFNLGLAQFSCLRYEDALLSLNQAIVHTMDEEGEDNPQAATIYKTIGDVYVGLKDYRLAMAKGYGRQIALLERVEGVPPDAIATPLTGMAVCFEALGNLPEAIEYRTRAAALLRASLGMNHEETITQLYNLGALYASSGRDSEAFRFFMEVQAAAEATLGKNHSISNSIRAILAHRNEKFGKRRPGSLVDGTPAQDDVVIFSVWAYKQGAFFRSWRRRFFTLRGSGELVYSGSEQKGSEKGSIRIDVRTTKVHNAAACQAMQAWPKEKPDWPKTAPADARMAIQTATRTYFLYCDDASAAESLLRAINSLYTTDGPLPDNEALRERRPSIVVRTTPPAPLERAASAASPEGTGAEETPRVVAAVAAASGVAAAPAAAPAAVAVASSSSNSPGKSKLALAGGSKKELEALASSVEAQAPRLSGSNISAADVAEGPNALDESEEEEEIEETAAVAASDASTSEAEVNSPPLAVWAWKQGYHFQSWKKRFFFLADEGLGYSLDEKQATRAVIELSPMCKVRAGSECDDVSQFGKDKPAWPATMVPGANIAVTTPVRTYFLYCDTKEDADTLHTALLFKLDMILHAHDEKEDNGEGDQRASLSAGDDTFTKNMKEHGLTHISSDGTVKTLTSAVLPPPLDISSFFGPPSGTSES